MSHGIVKPYDRLFSTEGTEWHGFSEHVESIGEAEANVLSFPIIESPCYFQNPVNGSFIRIPNRKTLVADLSHRTDLAEDERLLPLHNPKDGYKPIENREVFNATIQVIEGFDVKITSMGTLESCGKFFISCNIGQDVIQAPRGEKILGNLCLTTSHDGTMAFEAYDSTVRIVCMNTLRWSRGAAGEVGFKIYHTKNSGEQIAKFTELLAAVLAGREQLAEVFAYLYDIECKTEQARAIALGYLNSMNSANSKNACSTQAYNGADEITALFVRGAGNEGKNFYDLLNGATEYWTAGSGTGKKDDTADDRLKKFYKAQFGMAAEHKENFVRMLTNPEQVAACQELGERLLKDKKA